jgi:HK97 family phage major capsid protein
MDPHLQPSLLERLGDSSMPIGRMDLGPLCSVDDYVAMVESGSWGQPRMAVNNTTPSIPDTARQTLYYGMVAQPRRRLRLLDLIPTSAMDGRSFDFTREGGTWDQDAAETAEGALKPGADIALTDGQVVARTIATWLKLKRQQISDVPQLAQTANDRLVYKVNRRLENQIVAGDGTGENLIGILNTTGIGSEAYTAGDVLADDVSKGIRDVLLSDLEPNAVVVNPTDLQRIWTAKSAGSGEYFGGGPFAANPDNLWGLPAIPSKVMPAGQALVGDFTNGARVFIREAPNLRVSDADQDDFLRNQVTLLAEMRAGLAIWQPAAFCLVHLS